MGQGVCPKPPPSGIVGYRFTGVWKGWRWQNGVAIERVEP